MNCGACRLSLNALTLLIRFNFPDALIVPVMEFVCQRHMGYEPDVCEHMIGDYWVRTSFAC